MKIFIFGKEKHKNNNTPEYKIYETLRYMYPETYYIDNKLSMVTFSRQENKYRIYIHGENKFLNIERDDSFLIRRSAFTKVGRQTLLYLNEIKEEYNLHFFSNPQILKITNDKYANYLLFQRLGIPTPLTIYIPKVNVNVTDTRLHKLAEKLGYPLIIKPIGGSLGNDVIKVFSEEQIKAVAETLYRIHGAVILQQYIESNYDVRVFTVGREILGGEIRYRIKNDYRSNVSKGAKIEYYEPDNRIKKYIYKVLDYLSEKYDNEVFTIGFDFIFDLNGNPYCLEINGSPGTKGISEALGYDVSEKTAELFYKQYTNLIY